MHPRAVADGHNPQVPFGDKALLQDERRTGKEIELGRCLLQPLRPDDLLGRIIAGIVTRT
jgi:hypothetical protein